MSNDIKKVRQKLNEVSSSLCLAKWQQVTTHLHNGTTHSCHHPIPHKIPLSEINEDSSALHNTFYKKVQRKAMLSGIRPKECDYCWKVEDADENNVSDRVLKSAEDWAFPLMDEVINAEWDKNVAPSYLEVSFGNECNFKCAYCSPVISSAILNEYQKHGHYKEMPYFSLDYLKKIQEFPYAKDEQNPYVEAFWNWYPEIQKSLKVFRITGGEPLLNPNTYQVLEKFITDPVPEMSFAINSNLSVPDVFIDKFIRLTKDVMDGSKVKHFELYTSLDTHGARAEYIRQGLKHEKFEDNLCKILEKLPDMDVTIMCTFNALAVTGFPEFIKYIAEIKKRFTSQNRSRIKLSIPYLRYPVFMSALVLPKEFHPYVEKGLDQMLKLALDGDIEIFDLSEINSVRRLLSWLQNTEVSQSTTSKQLSLLKSYLAESDSRKGTDFLTVFPEFESLWNTID